MRLAGLRNPFTLGVHHTPAPARCLYPYDYLATAKGLSPPTTTPAGTAPEGDARFGARERPPWLSVAVDGARGRSRMRGGQQPLDPGQPLVEFGHGHLVPGRFVLRGGPGLAGILADETRRHLCGDHRQCEHPGAHDEACGDAAPGGDRVEVAVSDGGDRDE